MSEILVKSVNALIVAEVEGGSPAARAGVRVGDLLQKINGRPLLDILDYRFHAADSRLRLTLERDGQPLAAPHASRTGPLPRTSCKPLK